MNTKKLIRNSYIKTIALLAVLLIVVLFVFFSLFIEKTKASEGEQFIKETDELYPSIREFALSYSDETLAQIININRNLNLGFCIRTNDGSPIWLSGEALEFESDSYPQVKGYVFPDSGYTAEDYYRIMEFAAWRLEIDGIVYQYEMTGNNVLKGDGFFFIPEEIDVISYIVEDPLKIDSALTRVPGEEKISIKHKEENNDSNISGVKYYSGTIKRTELFPLNDSIGFADDVNRFYLTSDSFEAADEKSDWICEDTGIFKKVFTCARTVKSLYSGETIDARIVFAKYTDFGEKYFNSMLMLVLLAISVFIITGIIICLNTRKSIIAMYDAEQNRRIMVNSIAHDLKTPVAAISAYAELIKDKDFTENREYFAGKIMKNSEILDSQLQSITRLSKIDNPDFKLTAEPVELKDLTEKVISGFDHEAGFPAVSIHGEKTWITADRRLIQMAVENFISNAFKNLSGEKGEIVIDINERYWSVFNTGNHIKSENLPKIWDAWFVGESDGKDTGSGLGLFAAKAILDAHNMTYTAENVENGVRFTFYYGHLNRPKVKSTTL